MPDQHLEALLSARLFLEPQLAGGRVYFLSNLGGHLSLYAMDVAGSVPEQLLPPTLAMQNPDLVDGESFVVIPGSTGSWWPSTVTETSATCPT